MIKKDKTTNLGCTISPYTIFCLLTAIIGFHKHSSYFWAIFDFFLAPITWIVWIFGHSITLTIIKESFYWFFK